MVERLADLVSHESPSNDPALLAACADVLTGWGDAAFGRSVTRVVRDGRPHLLWRAPKPGVLLLGHFDTVWPAGTTAQWPMTVVDGVARGPGVFDMKAGIVQMLAALELVADTSRVSMLLTCDEETDSHTSRELIEQEAQWAGAGRRCVVGSTDVLNPCRARGQIAWASSVNAAATRVVGGASMASS
jgi:glutamate carboxypeptidase